MGRPAGEMEELPWARRLWIAEVEVEVEKKGELP
jgi:hypothetical protein